MKQKRANVRKQIRDATRGLTAIMQEGLAVMADDLIDRLTGRFSRATPAQRVNLTKDLKTRGAAAYRRAIRDALAVIADEALREAREEVPKAKRVKLSTEFDALPASVRKKLLRKSALLVGTQIGDLEKAVFFQFQSSYDTTPDPAILRADLSDAAEDFIEGNSIVAGASAQAAETIKEARNAFFFQPDTLEEIAAFEFVNGDPVSEICQDLAGTVFAKDDPEMFRFTPPLHFNAVLGGSLITTINGVMPIEHVRVGDFVLTHENKFRRVTEHMDKFEDKEVFVLKLETGQELTLTGEHPVLTARGWVRADEIHMSDDVICAEELR